MYSVLDKNLVNGYNSLELGNTGALCSWAEQEAGKLGPANPVYCFLSTRGW